MSTEDATGHVCNAYCTAAAHVDLVYVDSADLDHVAQQVIVAYWYRLGLTVVRVEPATEARPLPLIPPGLRQHIGTHRPTAPTAPAYLVWYSSAT